MDISGAETLRGRLTSHWQHHGCLCPRSTPLVFKRSTSSGNGIPRGSKLAFGNPLSLPGGSFTTSLTVVTPVLTKIGYPHCANKRLNKRRRHSFHLAVNSQPPPIAKQDPHSVDTTPDRPCCIKRGEWLECSQRIRLPMFSRTIGSPTRAPLHPP